MLSTTHARFFRPGERRRADEASQEGATATTPPILWLELLDVHVEFSLELALLLQLFVLRGALWRPEQKVILNLRFSLPALWWTISTTRWKFVVIRHLLHNRPTMLPFLHRARSADSRQRASLSHTHHFLFGSFRGKLCRLKQLVLEFHFRVSVLDFLDGFGGGHNYWWLIDLSCAI